MVLLHRLLALPPALLGLVLERSYLGEAQELEWPYNLPSHVKYYPEDEYLVKRNIEIRQRLQQQNPVGMRKMSGDPGEMFFLDYWHFGTDLESNDGDRRNNISTTAEVIAPLKLHADSRYRRSVLPRFLRRTVFDKRDYQCPAGSTACTSIDRPNSCCGDGSTCQLVQDVGLGDVGCCPESKVCGGSVSTCPANYLSCPQNPGGGCCVPGYACFDVGCVATSTAVVTVVRTYSSTSTITSTSLSTSTPPPPALPSTETQIETRTQTQISTQTETQVQTQTETTTIVPLPVVPTDPTSVSESFTSSTVAVGPSVTTTTDTTIATETGATTTTVLSDATITATTTSTSSLVNSLVCSSGFRSCPASLGGGCCPTDRACARDVCPELSSTDSFAAPARPTSNTVDATTTSTAAGFSSIPGAECPTGFYACSAFYQGGCCQTGRDCQPTSCPAGTSITVVGGSSITIDAPTGNGASSVASLLTGVCPTGWSTCAADVGGGCCQSGYACGSACTATGTGGQGSVVGKIAPNEAGKGPDPRWTWMMMTCSLMGTAIVFGCLA